MTVRTQYEADLTALKAALVEMGQNSANAVEAALEALCTADAEAAAAIVKGDGRINNMERDIEHRCMTLLLRQQPVAGDLRRVSTAMKVVTDIERMGDHAADIAEIIPHLVTANMYAITAASQAIWTPSPPWPGRMSLPPRRSLPPTTRWTMTSTPSSTPSLRRSPPTPPRWTPRSTC